jgi:hypothetical protein
MQLLTIRPQIAARPPALLAAPAKKPENVGPATAIFAAGSL